MQASTIFSNSRGYLLGLSALVLLGLIGAVSALKLGDSEAARAMAAPPATPPPCSSAWTVVASADQVPQGNKLLAVTVIAPDDIWAAGGYYGTIGLEDDSPLAEHWDGSSWSITPVPVNYFGGDLFGISGAASDDVWAVGEILGYQGQPEGALLEHWNGSAWSQMSSPTTNGQFQAVIALAHDNVWAVGLADSFSGGGLIAHYNGVQWTIDYTARATRPSLPGEYPTALFGLAASGPSDIWAVGTLDFNNSDRPLIMHYDGSSWNIVTTPNPAGVYSALWSVTAISPTDAWAVGDSQLTGSDPHTTLTLHWDGSAWTIVPSPNPLAQQLPGGYATGDFLTGVVATSSTEVWAVGHTLTQVYPNTYLNTITLRWNGTEWSQVHSPSPTGQDKLYAVAAVAPGYLWAVGSQNYDFNTLTELYGPPCGNTPVATASSTSMPSLTATATPRPASPTTNPTGEPTGQPSSTPVISTNTPAPADSSTPSVTPSATATVPAPTATPTACTIQFSDVPQGSTFYPFIHCLACLGIINGYRDGTFKPNNNVTRGELSKIVSNAAGFNDNQIVQMFEDVPVGSTFFQYIGRLASRGFISGYPCGGPGEPCGPGNLPYFRPNANSTRGQISKIVSNAAGFSENPTGQQFQDVAPSNAFYPFIYRLVFHSVMSGYTCGTPPAGVCVQPNNLPYFLPNANATRGQTSKIVSNTFFPDCQTSDIVQRR